MATSSSGNSVPASEAVQVLVSALADESLSVRVASMASLKDIAALNPPLVLDCCYAVSRGGRRRFGNMAGIFQVMSVGVQALEAGEVDSVFMSKLAKLATTEMISSKAHWQRAASGLLVSIGSHLPDLMMEEVFVHFSGPSSALPAMVQILADYASADVLKICQFKLNLLPTLIQLKRCSSLQGLKACSPEFYPSLGMFEIPNDQFSQMAVRQYILEFPSKSSFDGDVMSFLNSAFELLLRVWATSRDLKVHTSSVEALGQMVGLISRTQLKAALPKLVPTILELYKREKEIAYLATCSLYNVLYSSLMSESGPPMLDFEDLTVILSTLLPVVCVNNESKDRSDFSMGLKTYNEVQRCFLAVGIVYPEDLFVFLMNKCRLKEEPLTFGALCVLKHLLPRLSEAWHSKRPSLVEAAKLLLDEQNLGVRKALSELIVVMASHCYLVGPSGELFVEYLVRHCAVSDLERDDAESFNQHRRTEVKIGSVSPSELRTICEKGLLLITITIPEMEMIIPRIYTGAVATEIFARLVVLLHNPLAREQLASQILAVLYNLAPLFPKNINLFWQDEIPKMKAYISDPEDLKQDLSYQEAWDDMIINFLAESLDVIQDIDWVISLGNAFTRQYELYTSDDEHSALLHRCLGMLLQKVNDRAFVRERIGWMYKQANIANPTNRLGLAKAMGLVAASHLDTVLEKLKDILDNVGQSIIERFLSLFSDSFRSVESDDIHAALALMYGYAARYAPSTGTNMLSRLLHVRHPTAKQAVITAIDLLGRAVINAAESGASFPLKRRDQLLDYILTLMGRDENDDWSESSLELLHTQSLALSACTTLVSVEPKLTIETRNHVLKATLGFFALPNDPIDVVNPLIDNLISLLCAILLTSGEDGRSRAEQLLHILRQVDRYVASSVDYQRKRGCLAVYEMLARFRMLCVSGHSAYVLPTREALSLGDRVIVYLARCADTNSEVRKLSAQILDQIFSTSLSLPRPANASSVVDLESSYSALSSLEDVIEILRSDASIDPSEVFNRIVSSVCVLLTKDELVATLHGCTAAICDKVKQSAEGAIQAVNDFVTKRGAELNETDVSRDMATKDITRLRGGWPMQDAFYAFSQHAVLSQLFLEHVISILNQTPMVKVEPEKGENSSNSVDNKMDNEFVRPAVFALTAFFRGGGKVGKKAVEQSYSYVLAELIIQFGSCHRLASTGQLEPLQALLAAFQAFCECVGDLEMGKILARDGENNENERWISVIGELAGSISIKRPKEIPSLHILQYTAQVLSVILALLDDMDESVQLTAVSCLLMILESAPSDAVEPILLNLSVRLRNLQISMNVKMRTDAFAAFGALSSYGVGAQREAFLEQVHAALPRLVLHLHDDNQTVRQACRNTLKRIAPFFETHEFSVLFSMQAFNSDHRGDYEDFIRNLAKQLSEHLSSRVSTYMASIIQAFDAPWPIIQANAMYLACSILSLSDDQHILAIYYTQVFGMLVGKMSRSADAVVRATCSSALGLLLKSSNSVSWREARLDRVDSIRRDQGSDSSRR
ncbi:hypothetical protein CDL15_Pgr025525 [Punica granatum]|uniref:Protein SHOOT GRAVITROPISM 6 n=1 Tax=Punica granatum TaxID=22663 RepID=A0A218WAJ0_PUNGR|nr:hypothetical protein CDL15_Pgr025525 [Punica granatum]